MADFLVAVSTKKTKEVEPLVQKVQTLEIHDHLDIESPSAALEALKSQPSHGALKDILKFLASEGFSLLLPSALNASIAHQLVNDTIPNYWRALRTSKESKLITQILQNPTGLGHTVTRLRALIVESKQKKSHDQARSAVEHIEDLIEVLDRTLHGDQCSRLVLHHIQLLGKSDIQKKLLWREYLAQVASGRILALVAEAEDVLTKDGSRSSSSWIANGNQYATWIGCNMVALLADTSAESKNDDFRSAVAELFSKTLTLGYTNCVTSSILSALIENNNIQSLTALLSRMKTFEQRKYFDAILTSIVKDYMSADGLSGRGDPIASSSTVSGGAYLIDSIISNLDALKDHIVTSLTRSSIPALTESLAIRRSVIAALAKDEDKLHNLLESCIKLFGDSSYIKHVPILQQEALAQTLVLCSGCVHRSQPMFLTMMAKSSYHVNGMSNRIGAPSARARFLGIAVGSAISKMVDKADLQLKFDLEGEEVEEALWYQHLTKVDDKIGSMADLKTQRKASKVAVRLPSKPKPVKKPSIMPLHTEIQGPRITEVLSGSEDEDADLMVYEKPDSDPEDDTDDPTALTRNKPIAPVYIRDLIAGLRDQENYDRHELALATAAPLIRRKANFGTEVIDHLEDLATVLAGLQNNSELETFAQQRQQALIAVLLAKPAQMAQWLARSFFSGDYSLTQRIAMLTTLGLGARELAGLKDNSTEDLVPAKQAFPSKELPPHLHEVYTEDKAPTVAKISSRMAREMLSPMASRAADQLSGPNILKVRTFSSRMEVERKRPKPVANALAQIVADNFFFPLTGRWWLQVRAHNASSIYSSSHLLPPFLQTLSILLHAAGPNTLALPQMTREYWDLLLSVRGLAGSDKNVLGAVLFGFLMLLETNENKERVATEQGAELLETQAWVKMVFEGLGAGAEEDERIRVLAAGVVVRCQEVVDRYQRRMAGALMDY
ncbi:telomere binding protein [Coniothyrium glycines]